MSERDSVYQDNSQGGDDSARRSKPVASWEDVDPKIREAVESRIARFKPADASISLPENGDRGLLDVSGIELEQETLILLLRDRLANLVGVTRLNLGSNSIGKAGIRAIARHASDFKSLTHLELSHIGIGFTGAKALAQHAADFKALTHLDLSGNSIGDSGAKALAQHAADFKALTHLDLSGNSIGEASAIALAHHAAGFKFLTHLYLGGNRIGDVGTTALAQHAADFKALTHLHLFDNSIGKVGVTDLAQHAAEFKALAHLHLFRNFIRDSGAAILAQHAANFKTLTHLDLGDNKIGDSGVTALAQHAANFKTLKYLGLGDNSIGESGARALAEHAADFQALTHLRLTNNAIRDAGAKALAEHAADFKALTHLDIGGNKIVEPGAIYLAKHAANFKYLTHLRLTDNAIRDAGARALAEHAADFKSLAYLDIGNNSIGQSESILALIQRIPTLRQIVVSGNPLCVNNRSVRIAESYLEESNPQKLKALIESLLFDGEDTPFARLTTAGVSGSGKTHYTRRLEMPDDPRLDHPLEQTADGQGRITVGVRSTKVAFRPREYDVDLTDLQLVVQDVGGHCQQHKAHHHLVYLAGESVFVLCIKIRDPIDGWPRYYMAMLEELVRRRYSAKNPKAKAELRREHFPDDQKLRVVVVPTHKDGPDDRSKIEQNIKDLRAALDEHWMLASVICEPISNLDPSDHRKVNKLVAEQLRNLPDLQQRTLAFIPKLCEKVQKHFHELDDKRQRFKHVSLTVAQVQSWCDELDGYREDYLKPAVLELLRLGEVMVPLSSRPDPESDPLRPVTRDIALLLNPDFINKQLYGLLMNQRLDTQPGAVISEGTLDKLLDVNAMEMELIKKILREHLVAFDYVRAGLPNGLIVPDRLPEQIPGQPLPNWAKDWAQSTVKFDGFVPEHALFLLMRDHQEMLVPLDSATHVIAYRDMCRFHDDMTETAILVRLDVLNRKASIHVQGPGGDNWIRTFAQELARHADCPTTTTYAGLRLQHQQTVPSLWPPIGCDVDLVRKHLHAGIASYGALQMWAFGKHAFFVLFGFASSVFTTTLPNESVLTPLALLSVLAVFVDLCVYEFWTEHIRKKAAYHFDHVEHGLFGTDQCALIRSEDDVLISQGQKSFPKAAPENWFVALDEVKVPEARYAIAAMQEASFRLNEHRWSVFGVIVLTAVGCVLLPLAIAYLASPDRVFHIAVAFISGTPWLALGMAATTRNGRALWAFGNVKAKSRQTLNEFTRKKINRPKLAEEGIKLLKETQRHRLAHSPVLDWVYRKLADKSNRSCEDDVKAFEKGQLL